MRRKVVEPSNPDLPIGELCKLLPISRSSFYYTPKSETAMNLMLMRKIDEPILETASIPQPLQPPYSTTSKS